jgi:hypothetical protein
VIPPFHRKKRREKNPDARASKSRLEMPLGDLMHSKHSSNYTKNFFASFLQTNKKEVPSPDVSYVFTFRT